MADFMIVKSGYAGFIPPDTDGNAKVKTEFVREVVRDKKEKVEVVPASENKVLEVTSGEQQQQQSKQGRKRGQNKKRPHVQQRTDFSTRLCPSLVSKFGSCHFGDKCKFLHDVSAYMKIKPKDIGDECTTFREQGECPFSFACRYASDHVKFNEEKGYVNVVREDKKPVVMGNVLSVELQRNLRKRKFQFDDSQNTLQALDKLQAKRKKLDQEKRDKNAAAGKNKKTDCCEEFIADCGDEAAEATSQKVENDPETTAEKTDTVADITVAPVKSLGVVTDCDLFPLRNAEKKTIDFRNKTYLAPLTTCGNLPFRVVCKRQGVDITCGEMAMVTNLLQGQTSEWALMKKHPSEDLFGVQVCGSFPDTMTRCAELLNKECNVDFVDINMGCPIDLVYKKGAGSALMRRPNRLFDIVTCMRNVLDAPLTCKMRTGVETRRNTAHEFLPTLKQCGVDLVTIHGRSREARYTKSADWSYVDRCAKYAAPMPIFGNGDVLTQRDYWSVIENTDISGVMIARGALIKPWIFTEIKERRDWDISSSERLEILKDFTNEGLMHWGSDTKGVENTRRFLLEWLSFLYRYIPLGVLEQAPQCINERPPNYVGRDDLETLFASNDCADWVKISEMLLGKVPDSFQFLPKHKANSYK